MTIIRYLVICFSDGDFWRIGMTDDPNEATDMMKSDVLFEMENRGYTEEDDDYVGVESGNYDSDTAYIDATSARFEDNNMYWDIMQIEVEV